MIAPQTKRNYIHMATATLKGKVKWFKYLDPARENPYKPYLDKEKKPIKDENGNVRYMKDWGTMFSVDSGIKQFLRQNKVKKQVKYDDDIEDYINLNLDETDKKGVKFNTRPEVVDADGNPWPTDKWIGHGSVVEVTVEVSKYDFKDITGAQISGASLIPKKFTVIDYVPYTKPGEKQDKPKRVDKTDWSSDLDD